MGFQFCKLGQAVIETEAKAISALSERIDDGFSEACQYLFDTKGRVIVMGMGKSGHIGNKIAATLSSTGTSAFFVHPAEAAHGDCGMITPSDSIMMISNSGETPELLVLLPFIKRYNIPLIILTGNLSASLSKAANIAIDTSVDEEACPLGLAPTTSTTAALVMGDALAIALLEAKGFTANDFALSHPGGKLGKKLLLRVDDLFASGDELPVIHDTATISEALIEVTRKKLGMACVVNAHNHLVGVFTDGDVRRALQQTVDIHTTPVLNVMSKNPRTISKGILASEALNVMEKHKITSIVIVDNEQPVGVIHMHHLLSSGLI